jgi:hypothetical protein
LPHRSPYDRFNAGAADIFTQGVVARLWVDHPYLVLYRITPDRRHLSGFVFAFCQFALGRLTQFDKINLAGIAAFNTFFPGPP